MTKNRASDSEMADDSNPSLSPEGSPEQDDIQMDVSGLSLVFALCVCDSLGRRFANAKFHSFRMPT